MSNLYADSVEGKSEDWVAGFSYGTVLVAKENFLKFKEILDDNSKDVVGFSSEIIDLYAKLGHMLYTHGILTLEELV